MARTSILLIGVLKVVAALKYMAEYMDYNLNTNQTATSVVDYWGEWEDHDFFPSPDNWRMPFYCLMLDRFVNGDPTNDNANDTLFEHDLSSNQMRDGGDLQGLLDTLDYLHGMGIRVRFITADLTGNVNSLQGIYLAGPPLINQPWGADGYSILDHSLLDFHYGTLKLWRKAITEIHERGMYVVMDNTMGT